jgi:TDG/mug DNA glycosylase family protein
MVLPDLLAPALEVVFCGTAVGAASEREGAYYAGPGNSFWPALHAAGFTSIQFQPSEYKQLLKLRMGLTDLVKHVSGNDDALSKGHFDRERLKVSIQTFRPKILAFTGKRAAQEFVGRRVEYGCLETVEATMLFVLPSPSGAARKYWSIEPWNELSRLRSRR